MAFEVMRRRIYGPAERYCNGSGLAVIRPTRELAERTFEDMLRQPCDYPQAIFVVDLSTMRVVRQSGPSLEEVDSAMRAAWRRRYAPQPGVDEARRGAEDKPVDLRITSRGAVRVNSARVVRAAADIACLEVDLYTKYARIDSTEIGGSGHAPGVGLVAGEDAIHLDESAPRDSATVLEFPEYSGWTLFSCEQPSRYTLKLVLVRPSDGAPCAN